MTTTELVKTKNKTEPTGKEEKKVLALEIRGVTKEFVDKRAFGLNALWGGKKKIIKAVKDVSLNARRGEIVGVLGPNGSGKSTLIRLIATLLLADAGEIRVFGHHVEKEDFLVKRMINRVSAEASFFKKLSPIENLLYAARLYGLSGNEIKETGLAILERLGIEEERVYQPMEKMSRGMQQKVAIARGFLSSPILLLLDEPTTGLDPRSKREVQKFILEIRAEHDSTILLTTHDMEEADRVCDRIAIIDLGEVIAEETPQGLKKMIPGNGGREPSLEDVFIELTGRTLEEGDRKNKVRI